MSNYDQSTKLDMWQRLPIPACAAATHRHWARLEAALHCFKWLVAHADKEAITSGEISAELAEKVRASFRTLCLLMYQEIGDSASVAQPVKDACGAQLQCELLPYLLLTHTAEKWYAKPRGYAGDFMTIADVYRNQPTGSGRVGALLDRCLLDVPAAIAVQNRRQLLADEILRTISLSASNGPVHITSLACGPAAEIFDVFQQLPDPARLHVTLIDLDYQALAYVDEQVTRHKLQRQIRLHHGHLMHLATGRQRLELPVQDLVYSIGLIDYLSDERTVALIDWIHTLLRPGGRVVLGNFHPRNPTKALMDYVLDWKLVHRNEAEMDRLYTQSAFQRGCSNIYYEAQGINLFAECIK
jgi:SAM-dependent methyltransferase